jgi:hypothetical protein
VSQILTLAARLAASEPNQPSKGSAINLNRISDFEWDVSPLVDSFALWRPRRRWHPRRADIPKFNVPL